MYNFSLIENEKVSNIFDDVLVKQNNNEKNTTIILTNKRLLFFDYINDYREDLKVGKGIDYIKYKEVYYQINLIDIEKIIEDKIILKNKLVFEIYNKKLLELIQSIYKKQDIN